MTKAKLEQVSIGLIDANPMRKLKKYPLNKARVADLKGSIDDVGFFEGVHARKDGRRYQLAFGHHRVEACRQLGMTHLPLLVKQYEDEEMLKLLSRENDDVGEGRMEVFQEVWDGAVKFYAKDLTDVSDAARTMWIAEKLGGGWVVAKSSPAGTSKASNRARACAKIESHKLRHSAFKGVSARTAYEMIGRAESVEKKIDKAAERGDITPAKADKLAGEVWDTMAEVVEQDADPARNPGKKLGSREAIATFDEQKSVQNALEASRSQFTDRPKPKPVDKSAGAYRKWVGDVMDELGERHGSFFDAARFAADEPNTAAELKQVAAQLNRASEAFKRYADRTLKINNKGQSRPVLRGVK